MANNTTKKAGSNKSFIDRMGGQKFIVLLVVIALFIFFCAMSPNFRKYTTFINILDFSYYIVLMAIGVAFPLMTGGVDLSIGTGLVCYSLVGGYLIVHKGMPTIVGILAAIILGMLIGVLNGVLVAIMDLPAFLATLCTCMITRGLGSIIVGGFGISWPAASSTGWMVQKYLQDSVWRTEYPDRFLMGNSSGCCYDIRTESYKNWTLYTCNWK